MRGLQNADFPGKQMDAEFNTYFNGGREQGDVSL